MTAGHPISVIDAERQRSALSTACTLITQSRRVLGEARANRILAELRGVIREVDDRIDTMAAIN